MRKLEAFFGMVVFMFLLAFALGAFEKPIYKTAGYKDTIVRLHSPDDRFFCSGTVVGPHLVVTAAHCLLMDTPIGMIPSVEFVVVKNWDQTIVAKGTVAFASPQTDQAVLVGDFSGFGKRHVADAGAEDVKALYSPTAKLVSCGYPAGAALYCVPLTVIGPKDFWVMATGQLFPGMSGGPVIDLKTGSVVGVNTAVEDAHSLITPTIGILANTPNETKF